jgi:hypothetical protein
MIRPCQWPPPISSNARRPALQSCAKRQRERQLQARPANTGEMTATRRWLREATRIEGPRRVNLKRHASRFSRHSKAGSSFRIAVFCGRPMASRGRLALVPHRRTLDLKLLQKRLGLAWVRSASRAACLISPNVADKNMPNWPICFGGAGIRYCPLRSVAPRSFWVWGRSATCVFWGSWRSALR